MKLRCSLAVMLLHAVVAHAAVENVIETFDGGGPNESTGSVIAGFDNPGWYVNTDEPLVLEGGGLRLRTDLAFDTPDSEALRRTIFGRGGFITRIDLRNVQIPKWDEWNSDIASEAIIDAWHSLNRPSNSTLNFRIKESGHHEEHRWALNTLVNDDHDDRFMDWVPTGTDIRFEIILDTVKGVAGFRYDNDFEDDVPPMVIGPYAWTGVVDDSHPFTLSAYSHHDGTVDALVDYWSITPISGIAGDFDNNETLDAADIDELNWAIRAATNDFYYDLNDDGFVDATDRDMWLHDLKNTWYGDADLDGNFDSQDLMDTSAARTYETNIDAGWATGDFDGSGQFNSDDLIYASADGGYEAGPRAAIASVPEAATPATLLVGLIAVVSASRTRREPV